MPEDEDDVLIVKSPPKVQVSSPELIVLSDDSPVPPIVVSACFYKPVSQGKKIADELVECSKEEIVVAEEVERVLAPPPPPVRLDPRRVIVCNDCGRPCVGNVGYKAHMRSHQ